MGWNLKCLLCLVVFPQNIPKTTFEDIIIFQEINLNYFWFKMLRNKIEFCFCALELSEIISKKLNFVFGSKLEISSVFVRRRNGCYRILINFEDLGWGQPTIIVNVLKTHKSTK